jgi:hypothetical protein
VLVPANYTFNQLHLIIQGAFGWENYHLFTFSPGGFWTHPLISDKSMYDEDEEDIIDSDDILLSAIFKAEGQKFNYLYDFGDNWAHTLVLEQILDVRVLQPDCLTGKGACPPEDCGGVPGYAHLKQILANPKHKEHRSTKEWLGLAKDEKWDAEYFDLELAREMVREV